MKLSEAIRHGSTIRPESHQERFIEVENRGLCSDAWGAAVEAVWPHVAKLNWNPKKIFEFESAMNMLRGIQRRYFKEYFEMPAHCPGSQQRFIAMGGRVIKQGGKAFLKTYDDYAKTSDIGGITTECDKVSTLAGFVDHGFYAHGWSREECALAVEWYEQQKESAAVLNFQHYQVN